MFPEKIVYLSLIPSAFGMYFLVRDMLRGTTKPNLVSWLLWALAPLVGTFLLIKAGAGLSALPVFLAGFFPLIIFFLALAQGNARWKITGFDIICGIFSLIALVLWVITKRADISILFAIISDGLAAVPTVVKSWKFPETETGIAYLPGVINNVLGLLVIKNWEFSIYSFGIYFILMNLILFILIERKKLLQFFTKLVRKDAVN